MSLKVSSLTTCFSGWLLLAASFALTRVFATDKWSVVIPLTVHLFAYLTFATALVLSVLWMVWLGRWQEDFGVAIINALLALGPLVWLLWSYTHQSKGFSQFLLHLMWTGR